MNSEIIHIKWTKEEVRVPKKLLFTCIEPNGNLAAFDIASGPDAPPIFTLECTAIDGFAATLQARLGSEGDGSPFIIDTGTGEVSEGEVTEGGSRIPPHAGPLTIESDHARGRRAIHLAGLCWRDRLAAKRGEGDELGLELEGDGVSELTFSSLFRQAKRETE